MLTRTLQLVVPSKTFTDWKTGKNNIKMTIKHTWWFGSITKAHHETLCSGDLKRC